MRFPKKPKPKYLKVNVLLIIVWKQFYVTLSIVSTRIPFVASKMSSVYLTPSQALQSKHPSHYSYNNLNDSSVLFIKNVCCVLHVFDHSQRKEIQMCMSDDCVGQVIKGGLIGSSLIFNFVLDLWFYQHISCILKLLIPMLTGVLT